MQTGSAPGYLAMLSFLGSDSGKAPLKTGSRKANLLFPRSLRNHLPRAVVFPDDELICCSLTNPVEKGLQQPAGHSQHQGEQGGGVL